MTLPRLQGLLRQLIIDLMDENRNIHGRRPGEGLEGPPFTAFDLVEAEYRRCVLYFDYCCILNHENFGGLLGLMLRHRPSLVENAAFMAYIDRLAPFQTPDEDFDVSNPGLMSAANFERF